nr:MAG TPA: hypothetical protein [Caudovirales sp. ctNII2]
MEAKRGHGMKAQPKECHSSTATFWTPGKPV